MQLRKSRHLGDPDDPRLLETHRQILSSLAETDGVPIPAENVIVEVESGEFLADRPEFRRRLEEWERLPEGAGGVLYTMAFDRLSRGDPLERARVRVALRRAGIVVRTPSGFLDLADHDQALLAGIRSELAEHELARFKWRLEQTFAAKVRRGELAVAAAPFGYTWDRNTKQPRPDPREFPILKACCREIHAASVEQLALRYGVPSSTLHQALTNPVICGWAARRFRMGFQPCGRRHSRPMERARWVWAEVPGRWPAACTRAEWEAIQTTLHLRRLKTEWTTLSDGWCRDVLQFVPAVPGRVRLDTNNVLKVYAVPNPQGGRSLAWIERDRLHAHVSAALAALLESGDILAAAALQGQRAGPSESEREAEQARLTAAIAARRAVLEQAVHEGLAAPGDEIQAAYRQEQQRLQAEIDALKRRLSALAAASPCADAGPLLKELAPVAARFGELWPECPAGLKRRTVNALVAAAPVAFTPAERRGQRPCRLLLPVVWHDWLAPFVEGK